MSTELRAPAAEGTAGPDCVRPASTEAAGAKTEVISIHDGEIEGFDHFTPASKVKVDRIVEEVSVADYDALMIPGGVGNPDQAVICLGPWLLIDAGAARGRTLTSWPTIGTGLRNAGAQWVDREVVVDVGIVTTRKPDDIPAFNEKMIEQFAENRVRTRGGTL